MSIRNLPMYVFSILMVLLVIACGPSTDDIWARRAIRERVNQGALIVDVRSPEEYNSGHIRGSINVPHREVKERLSLFGSDTSRPIVVYCGKGGRAEYARISLQEEGYTNVWNLGSYSNLVTEHPDLISG